MVEFALILPIFLLLLLIAADFGRFFFTYIQLNNSAREAVAYAAFNPTSDNATLTTIARRESNVQAQRGEGSVAATATCVDSAGTALTCVDATGGAGAGNRITVALTARFTFFTPLIGAFWSGGLPVSTSATAAVVDYASGSSGTPPSCTTLPPTPTFTWQSPDPINHPYLISVNAGASSTLASPCQTVGYNWDFGGVSVDPTGDHLREGLTQDYDYAGPGTYVVKLIASNAAGDSAAFQITVDLHPGTTPCLRPTANFTVSPAAILSGSGNPTNWTYYKNDPHPGTAFTFDGSSSSFMSDTGCHPIWSWDLGGTTAPAAPIPATPTLASYRYRLSGSSAQTVHVTLTVRNDAGNDSRTIDLRLVQD
jgi:Flp pilus assembly protein TadG